MIQGVFRSYWDTVSMICILYVVGFTPLQVRLKEFWLMDQFTEDGEGGYGIKMVEMSVGITVMAIESQFSQWMSNVFT